MQFISQTPQIRVKVRNKYLGLSDNGLTEGYLLSVTSIPSRPLFFSVHLESGAVWSRLPVTALLCERYRSKITAAPFELPLKIAQPYSCLEGDIMAYEIRALKDYNVKIKTEDHRVLEGNYLFTVDVIGPGLTEDSLQTKNHNICVLGEGNLVAMPNNKVLFLDKHFTEEASWPNYRRQDHYYVVE